MLEAVESIYAHALSLTRLFTEGAALSSAGDGELTADSAPGSAMELGPVSAHSFHVTLEMGVSFLLRGRFIHNAHSCTEPSKCILRLKMAGDAEPWVHLFQSRPDPQARAWVCPS